MATHRKAGIVTGAGSGIGLATTKALVAQGYHVLAVDLQNLPQDGGLTVGETDLVAFHRGDVVDPETARGSVAIFAERGWSLDFLVNAAGISQPFAALHGTATADFKRVMSINLAGTFTMYRAVAGAMLAGGKGGSIVNIASTAGIRPVENAGAYTASKFAVIGLTQTAALELAPHGIRVNAICPGVTDTPMFRANAGGAPRDKLAAAIPMQFLGDAAMIADAAAWLIGDSARYVTGIALPVDGGLQLV